MEDENWQRIYAFVSSLGKYRQDLLLAHNIAVNNNFDPLEKLLTEVYRLYFQFLADNKISEEKFIALLIQHLEISIITAFGSGCIVLQYILKKLRPLKNITIDERVSIQPIPRNVMTNNN